MSVDKQKPKAIEYRISEIKKIHFFENDPQEFKLSEKDIEKTDFKLGLIIDINGEEESIAHRLSVIVSPANNEEVRLFGSESSFKYIIKNFNNYFPGNRQKGYEIPKGFMEALLSISISGLRGMLAALNTIPEYKGNILPPVDAKNLLENYHKKLHAHDTE
jgi:hypothetical protein